MTDGLDELRELVRAARNDRKLTQEALAEAVRPATSRTTVALLEQGRRLPPAATLQAICEHLAIPRHHWENLLSSDALTRTEFEHSLSEMVGRRVTLRDHDASTTAVAESAVVGLFNTALTGPQLYASFCAALVYYSVPDPSLAYFDRYLGANAFSSTAEFERRVRSYQKDAIRLFSSFPEAYLRLATSKDLGGDLAPLASRSDRQYRERTAWDVIEQIPEERLPDLGYVSAARVQREKDERQVLADSLQELAERLDKQGRAGLDTYTVKKRRKMGSLLRKFDSAITHDLLSPLFAPDPDLLRRESTRLAPKATDAIERMELTQATGLRNLARYLAADSMDVYVATSMRNDADFSSVNRFVERLFSHEHIHPLKLRYFNPTQSWIEDRVAKGLVEALMLKRAQFTIYMAQKSDTFGKDSEASVALGQGKPVIVYVPRLVVPEANIDSERMGLSSRADLQAAIQSEGAGDDADVDDTTDHQGLLTHLLTVRLKRTNDDALVRAALNHWADFDFYSEDQRIENEAERAEYRSWLDTVVKRGQESAPNSAVRGHFIGILVATAANFERRANLFREVHPLALQVILSTGVLNGILVVRSIDSCASILSKLVRNELDLELSIDDQNYRLVERTTRSTIRVIGRHSLIGNAFAAYYSRMDRDAGS